MMLSKAEFRDYHERVAARLRAVAATCASGWMAALLMEKASDHERLAKEGGDRAGILSQAAD